MEKLKVNKQDELLKYLIKSSKKYNRKKLKSLLKHECISINGIKTTQFNHLIYPGDIIEILEFNYELGLPFDIIFENQDYIVINKPQELPSISNQKDPISAFQYLSLYVKDKNPKAKIFVVHRLDRDTSGVMIYAKNVKTQEFFQKNWSNIVKTRKYIAIIEGKLNPKQGNIKAPIKEYEDAFARVSKHGKEAYTLYKTIQTNDKFSLLELDLKTGRKNQIRVHLSYLKHPILGDKKYGSKINPLKRMALHSYELRINNLSFIAPLPTDFKKIML